MVYNTHKFDFTTKSNAKDKAPEWMDEFFKNVNKPKKEVNYKEAFENKPTTHYCSSCGTTLSASEVGKCGNCLAKK